MISIRITNVTASGNLFINVNVDELVEKDFCRRFKENKHKKNRNFHGVIYSNQLASAHIYKNGKFNIMGAKSRREVQDTCDEICQMLRIRSARDITFNNFCATTSCGCLIPRNEVFDFLRIQPETKSVFLEPELFPAIRWNFHDFGSTVSFFRTGKINSTGNKTETEAVNSLLLALKMLHRVSHLFSCAVFVTFSVQ